LYNPQRDKALSTSKKETKNHGTGNWSKGANGISWAKPTPLGDYLLGVYSRIFLESFEQKS
jgi:hypothetical protein